MSAATFKLSSNDGSSYLTAGVAMAGANALDWDVSGSYTMKAALQTPSSVSGVTWSVSKIDDGHSTGDITLTDNGDKTVSFTLAKNDPVSFVLTASAVASGTAITESLSIRVKTQNGFELGAVDEETESGTSGTAPVINDLVRSAPNYRDYKFSVTLVGSVGTEITTVLTLPAKFLVLGCHYYLSEAITGSGTATILVGQRTGTNQELVQSTAWTSATAANTMSGLATSVIGTDLTSGNNYKAFYTSSKNVDVSVAISTASITAGTIKGVIYGIDLT